MVVASNFLVQNADKMSVTKKNNNNNSTSTNNNEPEDPKPIIKLPEVDGVESCDADKCASKAKPPRCMLICRDNSHPFQDRVLSLERPVKIGRTVARAKASMSNAIFDCKVLSRHHALLWFKAGKFYLQDTKSSNGTFINNQRLSGTNEQSTPREVCSGDVVQFGVNVVENTKNVQHGCIVATLRLFLPDGSEAKASNVVSCPTNVSLEDLYKLNQYLQEAVKREKTLRFKLAMVQRLVDNTRQAADQSWKSYIHEDKLLSRIETVEGQLVAYSKHINNDKIREELFRLQEEKAQYQKAAKESLRKILKEKLDLSLQLEIYGSKLDEAEQERQSLRQIAKKNQHELQEFASKYSAAQKKISEILGKLAENEDVTREVIEKTDVEREYLMRRLTTKMSNERKLIGCLRSARVDLAFVHLQVTNLSTLVKNSENVENDEKGSSKAAQLVATALSKLNYMVELMDAVEIEGSEDEEDKDNSVEDEKTNLEQIRSSIETALNKKIVDLMLKGNFRKAKDSEKTNGLVDLSEEENRILDTNVTEMKEKIEDEIKEEKIEGSEKDYSTDGAESDVTELEFTQREEKEEEKVEEVARKRPAEDELEALREKCRALEEQEAELAKKYANLQSQCGDLLNATYTVPIHYVAPLAIVLLWMILEKIF